MAYDMHTADPQSLQGLAELEQRSADYARMADALTWLAERWRERPSLDEAAAAVGLSPTHFQRVFTRWAGVSPKTFTAAIGHAEARAALEDGASVLDATYDVGLSGPSRLHDLFVAQEAVTPGEARRRGAGVELRWGWAPTPFGKGLFVATPRGLCGLAFSDAGAEDENFEDMRRRWPAATWVRDDSAAREWALRVFGEGEGPVPLVLMGPPFHVQVWKALLRVPSGKTATYGEVAAWAGAPRAARAVGAAIGANPISWLIPCHRFIARDGRLTGYHWGLPRKAAMLSWERTHAA
ncbi:MAG TPA: bifunctional helix-turn-helix domain-containing protein/methylated-DNA--[protein]-cysteine S-methyltransferase [Caulobacteraceae bacterium]|jgi:AraC family transcriptional regulator of adaptative response/methylated-DNA-[protein]-cysteine methyltransferase